MAKKVTVINAVPSKTSQCKRQKLRVCGYARVSTGSKAQAESYATQITYFTEILAEALGIKEEGGEHE